MTKYLYMIIDVQLFIGNILTIIFLNFATPSQTHKTYTSQMKARKRVPKRTLEYRLPKEKVEPDENDLKKVKDGLLKELEEAEKNKEEWFNNELDKNLKSIK